MYKVSAAWLQLMQLAVKLHLWSRARAEHTHCLYPHRRGGGGGEGGEGEEGEEGRWQSHGWKLWLESGEGTGG